MAGNHPRRQRAAPPESGGESWARREKKQAVGGRQKAARYHGCQNVYENTSTYRKFKGLAGNCMWLMKKDLSRRNGFGAGEKGKLNLQG